MNSLYSELYLEEMENLPNSSCFLRPAVAFFFIACWCWNNKSIEGKIMQIASLFFRFVCSNLNLKLSEFVVLKEYNRIWARIDKTQAFNIPRTESSHSRLGT